MIGNLSIVGPKKVFTNGDHVSVDIKVQRHPSDPFFSDLVQGISAKLICRGQFVHENKSRMINFYTSPCVDAGISYITQETISANVELQFPQKYLELPSTLRFNGSSDGIEWFVIAHVHCTNDDFMLIALPCDFLQTSFGYTATILTNSIYINTVEGSNLQLMTSYPANGLTDLHALESNLNLRLECLSPGKFSFRRLAVQLEEVTRFHLINDGCSSVGNEEYNVSDEEDELPRRYYELCSYSPSQDIPLDEQSVNLSQFIRLNNVNSTFVPSYLSNELRHYFNIIVELALVYWDYDRQALIQIDRKFTIGQIDSRGPTLQQEPREIHRYELSGDSEYAEEDYEMDVNDYYYSEDDEMPLLYDAKNEVSTRTRIIDYSDSDGQHLPSLYEDPTDSQATASSFESQTENIFNERDVNSKNPRTTVNDDWDDAVNLVSALAI